MEYALHCKYRNGTENPCLLFFVVLEKNLIQFHNRVEDSQIHVLKHRSLHFLISFVPSQVRKKREQRSGCAFAKHHLHVTQNEIVACSKEEYNHF